MPEIAKITNTADLRKMLLDVITDVRKGNMNYKDANAISALSASILHSAKLDFEVMKMGLLENPQQPRAASLLLDGKKSAIEDDPEPEEETEDGADETVSKSAFTKKAQWYPKDWQDIKKSLVRGVEKGEIAEDYGVPIEELEAFIEANGGVPGEA